MSTVVQDAVSYTNVETYMFTCCSAFTSFWYNWESTGRPSLDGELQSILKELPSNEDCMSTDGLQFILSIDVSYKRFSSGMILDSCRVIEGKYIDLLEQEEARDHQKLWALGPFNPVAITRDSSPNRHKLFDWLDKQASNSVLYVSFGTTTSISNEQIQELAMGLEQSEQRFIWVLRDADKGDIFDGEVRKIELPKGFEERVGENGLVVVDWVPQPEILGHPATGGFMSHCGWNSSTESITMGVPVAAWPMHSDQPRNAMLITKVLNIGIYVRDWTRREELISSTVVEEAVRKLMASEEGEEMRKRAAELGGRVRRSVEDGGVRRIDSPPPRTLLPYRLPRRRFTPQDIPFKSRPSSNRSHRRIVPQSLHNRLQSPSSFLIGFTSILPSIVAFRASFDRRIVPQSLHNRLQSPSIAFVVSNRLHIYTTFNRRFQVLGSEPGSASVFQDHSRKHNVCY
ncbi:UDP-glucuronosyl/UDP-glucosyltransferase [Cynara cardunculus var. scolymus]|uniref:Glycosyltransferase n=1 Tax=Cynara cardunculus var. scolymus TaxID=59895 RepID=A0A124SG19_CYNCS|nr:UDP-glucuronosyl/UDP-glucosyltransferase [Cynara cardunculus var. scolymus]